MKRNLRFVRFAEDVIEQTPILKMRFSLTALWLLFSVGLYVAERSVEGSAITSYGRALY